MSDGTVDVAVSDAGGSGDAGSGPIETRRRLPSWLRLAWFGADARSVHPVSYSRVVPRPARSGPAFVVGMFAVGMIAIVACVSALTIVGTSASWVIAGFAVPRSHPRFTVIGVGLLLSLMVAGAWFVARRLRPAAGDVAIYEVTPTTVEPAPRRLRVRSWRWWGEVVAEIAAYASVLVMMYRSILTNLGSKVIGAGGDTDWFVFLSWQMGQRIGSGSLLPTRIPDVIVPYGFNLLVSDGYLPPLVGGLWNFVVGPYAAYNLALVTGTVLNLLGGRYLAAQISQQRLVQVLTACAFATAPVLFLRMAGHLFLTYIFPVALLVGECVHIARDPRQIRWLRLGAFLTLAYLCSVYFLITGGLIVAITVVVACLHHRVLVRPARQLAGALAICVVLISPFLVSRLSQSSREARAGAEQNVNLDEDYRIYAADGLGVVSPTHASIINLPGAKDFAPRVYTNGEDSAFPGFLLITGVGGLLLLRVPHRWPLTIAAFAIWLMTLGASLKVGGVFTTRAATGATVGWLPFNVLIEFPFLSTLRAPGRLGLALPAVLAAGTATGLDVAMRTIHRFRALGVGVVAVGSAFAVFLNAPVWQTSPPTLGADVQAALRDLRTKALPGERVAAVPFCWGKFLGPEALPQVWHELPAVGCQAPYFAIPFFGGIPDYRESRALAALRCAPPALAYAPTQFPNEVPIGDTELEELRTRWRVRFLVIDRTHLAAPECATTAANVEELFGRFGVVEPGRWSIIDIGSAGS